MTTKPKARKFRIRSDDSLARAQPVPEQAAAMPQTPAPEVTPNVATPAQVASEVSLDDIRREGLTGRQLRMARRVAQKNGLAVTSDFDAVRQLRAQGIDPFQRNTILELVAPDAAGGPDEPQGGGGKKALGKIQLPQTVKHGANLPSTETAPGVSPADRRAREIAKIQRELAQRRRRKLALLMTRLSVFVVLPTFLVGWYFYFMATPMYATNTEFVIQQNEASASPGGLGGLFQGTSLANQQDSIAVQSYLASRASMLRLDEDHGFKAHFSSDEVDSIQRLDPDASNEDAFDVYTGKVLVSYDPTEGILKMEVIAADPQTSQTYSEALVGYAEEQIDQLTQKPRNDAMAGAREAYEEAEARRTTALEAWLSIQEELQTADPLGETAALTAQISALEQERQQLLLTLEARLNVRRPNQAQVDALQSQINSRENLISDLRRQIGGSAAGSGTTAGDNLRLRLAEEDYTFQTLQVQAALAQMETARIAANRQVRYLSLGVEPVAPDEATYPRAFENTILAFLIFAGIYLMISLTASILREQVTS